MAIQFMQFKKNCTNCQIQKKGRNKYGKLPQKVSEAKPWDVMFLDLIVPYTLTLPYKNK